MHEEAAVAMAHGYAKASGKPIGALIHGSVGVQHAAMAIYNAWVDRAPVMIFAGNGLDGHMRRNITEWNHSVQSPALMVRDFVKWDDYPMSLQHFAESTVRAYKIAMTPPMEPVMITADIDCRKRRSTRRACASRSSRARARRRATGPRSPKRRSGSSAPSIP
jgi:thiamine pyrophosphate-dependent acetolactate synthase large subunit-like protein